MTGINQGRETVRRPEGPALLSVSRSIMKNNRLRLSEILVRTLSARDPTLPVIVLTELHFNRSIEKCSLP
jgi:hypothetical protein